MKRAFLFTIFFIIGSFIACFFCIKVCNDDNSKNAKDTVTVNDSVTYTDNNIEDMMIMMQTILLNNK